MASAYAHPTPKAGLLSGMAVTWITAIIVVGVGAAVPRLHPIFAGSPSRRLLDLLVASIVLMAAHKIESYFTREFDHCPVYLGMRQSRWGHDPLALAFVTFVSVFLGMMVLVALAMRDAPWPLLVLAIWCAQGLHELHHAAKSLSRRRYYPGTASALVFVAFMDLAFVPAYLGCLDVDARAVLACYFVAQPLLLGAFYLEDRSWLRRAAERGSAHESMTASVAP